MKLQDIFTSTGKLSSEKIKKFKLTEQYQQVLDKTNFLNKSVSLGERLFCIINNLTEPNKCSCGQYTKFKTFQIGYSKHCSVKCGSIDKSRNEKSAKTKLERYGDSKYTNKDKRKETCLKKYGTETPFHSKEIQNKVKNTVRDRYGIDNISQLEEVKYKKIDKCGNTKKFKETILQKKLLHPSYSKLLDSVWLENEYRQKTIIQIADDLNLAYSTVNNALISHDIDRNNWKNKSGIEQEVANFVKSLGFDIVQNSRSIIAPQEIDIFVPEKNIAIEMNGIFWHSAFDKATDIKMKNYHKDKANACFDKEIQLLQIFDNEWQNKKELWKSVIKAKLGLSEQIYARKCNFEIIESITGREFIERNHLQGKVNGGEYYGLYYNDELVSVIQIAKSRFNSAVDHEILRFCNKQNTSVIGGFSKLLSHIDITGKIVSYANKRWSSGKLYESAGFEYSHDTEPNYWYWNDKAELHNRIKFQKHKLEAILPKFDNILTESENMFINGYRKLSDAGNKVYVYDKYIDTIKGVTK